MATFSPCPTSSSLLQLKPSPCKTSRRCASFASITKPSSNVCMWRAGHKQKFQWTRRKSSTTLVVPQTEDIKETHARTKLFSFNSKSLMLGQQRENFVVLCSAAQESTTTVTDKKDTAETAAPAEKPAAAPATKPAEKLKRAPAKELPDLMQEDVIPSLKSTLESQKDLSQIELSFQDNRLEGSFVKDGITYYFWAFFPNGVLTGPKGFSLSSYGSEVSTIEPFLIDEKKITTKHVVFWVEKRLAAQGILPVWKKDEEGKTTN